MIHYVDSHSHLADPRIQVDRDLMILEAQKLGIQTFIQGGVSPDDWQMQIELKKTYQGIQLCFGLHPYFVAEHTDDDCENALNQLARMLPQAIAIGEMGFDFRSQYLGEGSYDRQVSVFEKQLELADFSKKPMVLHLVKAHDQVMKCFSVWGVPSSSGMVHSFNGTVKELEDFTKLGLSISVGGPLCRSGKGQLEEAIRQCPLDYLLLETDSPDQPPAGILNGKNSPSTLIQVAEKVAKIKQLSLNEVLDRCSANARKLFQI